MTLSVLFILLCSCFFILSPCDAGIRLGAILSKSDAMPQEQAAILLALRHINNKTDGIHDDILPSTELLIAIRTVESDIFTTVKTSQSLAVESFSGQGLTAVIGPSSATATRGKYIYLIMNYAH